MRILPDDWVEVVLRPYLLASSASADAAEVSSGGVGLGDADTVTSRRSSSGEVFISIIVQNKYKRISQVLYGLWVVPNLFDGCFRAVTQNAAVEGIFRRSFVLWFREGGSEGRAKKVITNFQIFGFFHDDSTPLCGCRGH